MHNIKGRDDLIMQGWTKSATHTRSSTTVFKTTTGFQVNKALVCYLCLCSQWYNYNCPHRASQFLDSVSTTWSIVTLAYNTQQSQNFLPLTSSAAVSNTLRIYYISLLVIYGCCSQQFLCNVDTSVLASITNFNQLIATWFVYSFLVYY